MSTLHRTHATGTRRPLTAGTRSVGLRRINPVYAALLRALGPPDSPDNPLVGTKYDTRIAAQREREKFLRRRAKANARWQRWDKWLHGHNPVPPPFQAWGPEGHDASEGADAAPRQHPPSQPP